VAATRVLAGRGGNLGQISVATDQEMGPAELRCQAEEALELPGERALAFQFAG
jgi:hypothetical protein